MLAANVQRAAEREKHTQRVRHGYAAYRIREFVRHVHEAWLDKARRKVMYATQPLHLPHAQTQAVRLSLTTICTAHVWYAACHDGGFDRA